MTSTNPTRASYLNRKFHFSILEASRMPTLISTVETFWVITGPILKIFHVKTSGLDYSDRQHRHEAVLDRSDEHTSEPQSLMRTSYPVLCLKTKIRNTDTNTKR